MNPRILKKLTKRADPYITEAYPHLTRVVVDINDHESVETHQRVERKYFERWRGKFNEYGYFTQLKGTIGFGCMSGYYEPEWVDTDAYSLLKEFVLDYFTDWKSFDPDEGGWPEIKVTLRNPSDVFKYADLIFKELNK